MSAPTSPRSGSSSSILGVFFAALGLAGLAAAILSSHWPLLGIAFALISFMAAASVLSNAARIARQLPGFVGKSVSVEVWGRPLEATTLEVQAVRAIGAGLHIYLLSSAAKSPQDLKIAQPRGTRLTDTEVTIDEAAYVSLAGTKLDRFHNQPALRMWWLAEGVEEKARGHSGTHPATISSVDARGTSSGFSESAAMRGCHAGRSP